ncbi:hypothetical protein AB0383_20165 [Amycolatopsis sp. NPDC051373]|uniref:hypothetical protein n=1 Tax=Amycolatopsis sp. NPDC051373 TaxID=3155801 RepID=UPI00344E06FF
MGMHASAYLMYGYDLGGAEEGWKIEEAGEYGEWEPEWAEDAGDPMGSVDDVLLRSVGFTETDWRVDGYFDRERAAKERLGVEVSSYGYHESASWMLTTKTIRGEDYGADAFDPAELLSLPAANGWDEKLRDALNTLGITPTQEAPSWFFVSNYG